MTTRKLPNPDGVMGVKPARLTPVKLRVRLEVDVVVSQLVWEQLEQSEEDSKVLLSLTNHSGQRWPLAEIDGLAEVLIIRVLPWWCGALGNSEGR